VVCDKDSLNACAHSLFKANNYQDIGRDVQPTDLDNPIHKIFRRERWEVTDEDYEVLLPSMRLASYLLEVGMDFIASFVPSDNLRDDIVGRLSYLEGYHGGDRQVSLIKDPDDQDLAMAREELNDIANVVKWQINNEMWRDNQWLGITRLTNAPRPWAGESPVEVHNSDSKLKKSEDTRRHIIIGIAGEYVDALKKFRVDSEEHLHARFQAAITMAHELGHTIWQQDFRALSRDMSEPYVEDENWAELGYSFISRIFHGHNPNICTVKGYDDLDWTLPMCWTPHLKVSTSAPRLHYKTLYSIPVKYMEDILSKKFWAALGDPRDLGFIMRAKERLRPQLDEQHAAIASEPEFEVEPGQDKAYWKSTFKDRDCLGLISVSTDEIQAVLESRGDRLYQEDDKDDWEGVFDVLHEPEEFNEDTFPIRQIEDGALISDKLPHWQPIFGLITPTRIEVRYRPGNNPIIRPLGNSKSRNKAGRDNRLDLKRPRLMSSAPAAPARGEDPFQWSTHEFTSYFQANNLPDWGNRAVKAARVFRHRSEQSPSGRPRKINQDSRGYVRRTNNDGVETYSWNANLSLVNVGDLRRAVCMKANLNSTAVPKLYLGKDRQSPLSEDSMALDEFGPRNWRDIWCVLESEDWNQPVEKALEIGHGTSNDENGPVVYKPRIPLPLGPRVVSSWADPSLKRAYDHIAIPEQVTVLELMQQVEQRASELDRVLQPGGGREILRPSFRGLKAENGGELAFPEGAGDHDGLITFGQSEDDFPLGPTSSHMRQLYENIGP
jgi:hypothetical protein